MSCSFVFPGMICACFIILMSYVGLCKKMTRFECPRTLQLKLQIKELLSRHKRIFFTTAAVFLLEQQFSSQCFFEKNCLGWSVQGPLPVKPIEHRHPERSANIENQVPKRFCRNQQLRLVRGQLEKRQFFFDNAGTSVYIYCWLGWAGCEARSEFE